SILLNNCDPDQAPTVSVPAGQAVLDTGPLTFGSGSGNAIGVADPDIGPFPAKVTLAVAHGSLSLATTTGLSFTAGDGTADPSMTFTGTLANVNAALNGLRYVPTAGFSGNNQLTIAIDDQKKSGVDGPKVANG